MSLFTTIDNLRSPAPSPRRVEWLTGQAYAHRGLHGMQDGRTILENSPAAFEAALAQNLGIECDVQASNDHAAFVFHDEDLERLTEATGAVIDRSALDLDRVQLRAGHGPIPRLAHLLDQVAGRVPILIEVKTHGRTRVKRLCLAVRRALEGYGGKVAVMSFDPRVGHWFYTNAPHVVRGLVITEEDRSGVKGRAQRHLALWHAKPDFLAYDLRDLPSRFASAQRERGLPVLTWTVRNAADERHAIRHADEIIFEHRAEG